MRQPKMINDPNAAPAAMRADDVDLQAQEGDFIMGYPAMQQSGPRVRSLVEQAMLRAKDAGVKTKGYKHGDKVDILAHNGEMQIPNQLIPYIDGGYATLKKLNQPSKYKFGDKVQSKENIPSEINKYTDDMKYETLETLSAPTKGHDEFSREKNNGMIFTSLYGTYGEQIWNKMKIRLSDMFNNRIQKSKKPINTESLYNEYIQTVKSIRNGIENSENNSTNIESLLDTHFLKSLEGFGTSENYDKENLSLNF